MARVVRRRSSPPPPADEPCTVCGMPSTTHWESRASSDIHLCDEHLERHRDALRKAEYRQKQ